jgi:hypothetical protein
MKLRDKLNILIIQMHSPDLFLIITKPIHPFFIFVHALNCNKRRNGCPGGRIKPAQL